MAALHVPNELITAANPRKYHADGSHRFHWFLEPEIALGDSKVFCPAKARGGAKADDTAVLLNLDVPGSFHGTNFK